MTVVMSYGRVAVVIHRLALDAQAVAGVRLAQRGVGGGVVSGLGAPVARRGGIVGGLGRSVARRRSVISGFGWIVGGLGRSVARRRSVISGFRWVVGGLGGAVAVEAGGGRGLVGGLGGAVGRRGCVVGRLRGAVAGGGGVVSLGGAVPVVLGLVVRRLGRLVDRLGGAVGGMGRVVVLDDRMAALGNEDSGNGRAVRHDLHGLHVLDVAVVKLLLDPVVVVGDGGVAGSRWATLKWVECIECRD